ncbi:DUF1801 domain-containing protein [uncultured Roseobacter sp.]|uniref:DUF1801 domain-containing protein n=1 Tax=uncultured Roseobacter sp. TaxID=114847 RepID=UPI0034579CBB
MTGADLTPAAFLEAVRPDARRDEAHRLDALFRRRTGWAAQLWRGDILGYGRYDYTYKSGRTGSWLATGFAPRRAKLTIYIMPGYTDFSPVLARLGRHTKGKSCLYLKRLEDVDMDVLGELIQAGTEDLAATWPVSAT